MYLNFIIYNFKVGENKIMVSDKFGRHAEVIAGTVYFRKLRPGSVMN